MFLKLRRIIFGLALLVASFALYGCGDTPPAVQTFEDFYGLVHDKNYGSAHGMLTDESKKRIKDAAALQVLCEGALKDIFFNAKGAVPEVKSPVLQQDGQVATGTIGLFDENGEQVAKNRGTWTVRKEGEAGWKIHWTLTTSDAGGLPDAVR